MFYNLNTNLVQYHNHPTYKNNEILFSRSNFVWMEATLVNVFMRSPLILILVFYFIMSLRINKYLRVIMKVILTYFKSYLI